MDMDIMRFGGIVQSCGRVMEITLGKVSRTCAILPAALLGMTSGITSISIGGDMATTILRQSPPVRLMACTLLFIRMERSNITFHWREFAHPWELDSKLVML